MRNLYLTADEAQERLLASGLSSLETIPTLEALDYWVNLVQVEMDNWLRQSILPTSYTDTLLANWQGMVTLPRSPVQEVHSVDAVIMQVGLPKQTIRLTANWQGGQMLAGLGANQKYAISYVAGYDPVPPIAAQVAFNLLVKVMLKGMDLNERTRHLTNVGLQGGISQSFQIGGDPKNSVSSRNIDDLMLPLKQYKKTLWT